MLSRLVYRVFVNDGLRFFCKGTESPNWQVYSAVCLERRPVITKELTDLEKEMLEYQNQVDIERSLKSDFETKQDAEAAADASAKKKSALQDTKKTADVKQSVISYRDILDEWEKEVQGVTLASRLTEADKNEDFKSVERKLDSRLFLAIRQTSAGDRWLFPQGTCIEGETLRESAERVLKDQCGPDLEARFISNAPCGFHKYGYPKSYREKTGLFGAKVFFYKAELLGGKVSSSTFQWRTKSELLSIVDEKYAKSLQKFLLDDS